MFDPTVVEKMVLHGAAACVNPLSARQCRILNSIQRKFLLNIYGAYSTSPTSALQIIDGILPLSFKAGQESTDDRVSRLNKLSHPIINHSAQLTMNQNFSTTNSIQLNLT
ncbi:hypothetical protein AVEN_194664-1 [Araneus ventricosus]|uniref:Uncharacterized protein n=1 Tax=Araneus ventricosus TaxID=182803 RepID=A0A4Y2A6P4_ARAVE|nr:hypothetical protein AVEN_194664-1 [Araneus ventricosus]